MMWCNDKTNIEILKGRWEQGSPPMLYRRNLFIDIETYFPGDLKKEGVHKVVEHCESEVLIFAYAFDNEAVKVIDIANGEKIPNEVIRGLDSDDVVKLCFNSEFEMTCLGKLLNINIHLHQWRCIAVMAATLGFPSGLDAVSKAMNLKVQKMDEGKELIKCFSLPCKPTVSNGYRTRNMAHHYIERWNTFKDYCGKDVEVARAIYNRLSDFYIPIREHELWQVHQSINNRGIKINKTMVDNAIRFNKIHEEKLKKEFTKITGITNVRSLVNFKQWLLDEHNIKVDNLNKETVSNLLINAHGDLKNALEIRQQLTKTSVKKYEAMDKACCEDERVRGLFRFYGAGRTGRWAGTKVQVHNLPQSNMENLDLGLNLLIAGDYEKFRELFPNVPETLSKLIRTTFIPEALHEFVVADFSSIEARIIAWLSNEQWRMKVFNTHGKLYEASAAKMFGVNINSIDKDNPLRQKGKVAELALGYQGGVGALKVMGALKMGIKEEELLNLVRTWRASNINIVRLWNTVEQCVIKAVRDNVPMYIDHGISFYCKDDILLITLPSGRALSYVEPRIDINPQFGNSIVTYMGMNQETKKWQRISSYGGKFVENIVQGIARDCLGEAMINLECKGYEIMLHVHDEVVIQVPKGEKHLEQIAEIMALPIHWAKNLPLKAEGFVSDYYRK